MEALHSGVSSAGLVGLAVPNMKSERRSDDGSRASVESCCRLLIQRGCAMSLVACPRRPAAGDLDLVTAFGGMGKVAAGRTIVVSGCG
jgi:hypothetical protein